MDNLNKTISFILGLVIVLVFLAVITGRLNLKEKIPLLTKSVTPTPSVTIAPTPASTMRVSPTANSGNQTYGRYQKTPGTIPATGSPTIILPLLFSSLFIGFYFKKNL